MKPPLSLEEVSTITGIPRNTLRSELLRGNIPGVKVPKGRRMVWAIEPHVLEQLLGKGDDYDQHHQGWVKSLKTGLGRRERVDDKTIESYQFGLDYYWSKLGTNPSIANITIDALSVVLASFQVDYEKQRDFFATKEKIYIAFSSFYRYLSQQGFKPPLDTEALRQIKPVRKFKKIKETLEIETVRRILEFNESHLVGRKRFDVALNRIILVTLCLTGLRRGELIALKLDHIDLERQMMIVVDGKHHKDRYTAIPVELVQELQAWLNFRPSGKSDYLLTGEDGFQLSQWAVNNRLRRLSKACGVKIHPHLLRKTNATLLNDLLVPLPDIKESLGHNDVRVTMGYIGASARTAAKKIKQVHFGLFDDPAQSQGTPQKTNLDFT